MLQAGIIDVFSRSTISKLWGVELKQLVPMLVLSLTVSLLLVIRRTHCQVVVLVLLVLIRTHYQAAALWW